MKNAIITTALVLVCMTAVATVMPADALGFVDPGPAVLPELDEVVGPFCPPTFFITDIREQGVPGFTDAELRVIDRNMDGDVCANFLRAVARRSAAVIDNVLPRKPRT